jgi:hypothetical protein
MQVIWLARVMLSLRYRKPQLTALSVQLGEKTLSYWSCDEARYDRASDRRNNSDAKASGTIMIIPNKAVVHPLKDSRYGE